MPTLAVDGNMKLDNMPMRNPDGDVSLSDGEAMFAGSQELGKCGYSTSGKSVAFLFIPTPLLGIILPDEPCWVLQAQDYLLI